MEYQLPAPCFLLHIELMTSFNIFQQTYAINVELVIYITTKCVVVGYVLKTNNFKIE